jgi:hypothetical protein
LGAILHSEARKIWYRTRRVTNTDQQTVPFTDENYRLETLWAIIHLPRSKSSRLTNLLNSMADYLASGLLSAVWLMVVLPEIRSSI